MSNITTETPSCDHAVITHRSFKDEIIDDMLRRSNVSKYDFLRGYEGFNNNEVGAEELAKKLGKVGHLQYLSLIHAKEDRKRVKRILDDVRSCHHNYVIEPINIDIDQLGKIENGEELVNLGDKRNYFLNEKIASPHNLFTISTLATQESKQVKLFVVIIASHKHNDYTIAVFNSPTGYQFVCGQYGVQVSYGNIDMREIMTQRGAIQGEFDMVSQAGLLAAGIQAFSNLMKLLSEPAEYIQAEYMADGEEDLDERSERDPSTRKQPKKQIFIRKVMPKISTMGPVDSPVGSEGPVQLQHERAGHWRRYRNGRKVWVRSCIAGDPTLGTTVGRERTIEVLGRRP